MGIFRRKKSKRANQTGNGADFAGESAAAVLEAAPGLVRVIGGAIGKVVSGIAHALT